MYLKVLCTALIAGFYYSTSLFLSYNTKIQSYDSKYVDQFYFTNPLLTLLIFQCIYPIIFTMNSLLTNIVNPLVSSCITSVLTSFVASPFGAILMYQLVTNADLIKAVTETYSRGGWFNTVIPLMVRNGCYGIFLLNQDIFNFTNFIILDSFIKATFISIITAFVDYYIAILHYDPQFNLDKYYNLLKQNKLIWLTGIYYRIFMILIELIAFAVAFN